MIAFFPTPYHDELIYSQLARYYVHSGYMGYRFAAEDLYTSNAIRPDVELLNHFTEDALTAITRNTTMENIIYKHTMFPYYARFLAFERRQKALQTLLRMDPNIRHELAIPKNKSGTTRYIRYCPVCAAEDRETYGETYWHRSHQMIGVNLCPQHFCRLMDSTVIIGKSSPALVSAEISVPYENTVVFSENQVENAVAQYIHNVFQSDVDMISNIAPGDFLHSRMEGTKYLSVRGEQRNLGLICHDYNKYYQGLPGHCKELWELQKIFTNNYRSTYDVCLLAIFLGVASTDLACMELPEKSQEQRFDEQIHELHQQGLLYPEIAERLNASVHIVRAIGAKRYGTHHKKPVNPGMKPGVKALNLDRLDRDTLPKVIMAIKQLQGDGSIRPKRVTMYAVENFLGLPCKRLNNLPLCKAEIDKHYEETPMYWAREVVWAANDVLVHNEPFNWKHLRIRTNMRRKDLQACIPYLHRYTDDAELIDAITAL